MGEFADMLMDEAFCGDYWEYEDDGVEEWYPKDVTHFFRVDCILIHSTTKAYLVKIFDKDEWFPKSYCVLDKDKIKIPSWLAVRKGLPVHRMEMI